MFDPIKTLNRRLFKQNTGRNLVAVIAILLTTLMFTTLFTLAQSQSKNVVEMAFRQAGYDAQVSLKNVTEEQLARLSAHPDIAGIGESIVLGLAENKALGGRQLEIRWADDSYARHSFGAPTAGRMPQAAGELALDTIALDRLGLPHELGQEVTLEWRRDFNSGEVTSTTFTLCGLWDGNESSYASFAWVSREYADQMTGGRPAVEGQALGMHMAQLHLVSDANIAGMMEDILADTGLTGLEYSVNLAYSPELNANAAMESAPMYLGMALVFLAGYLIIYNIFQISVTADIQFYGQLKTLGTTTRQIKKLIYGQVNRLCVIAIPAGLLSGWGLGVLLVPVLMGRMDGGAAANPVIFIGSAAFAYLTSAISCLQPARLAGKVSPIEALRMSDAAISKQKKRRRSHETATLSGMAWANLGRNKKRTAIVVCALTLGLVLLSCFYAKDAAFDMEKYLADLTLADFELSDASHENYIGGYDPQGTTLDGELALQLENAEGVEAVGHQYSHQFSWQPDAKTLENIGLFYTEDMLKNWASYDPTGPESVRAVLAGGPMTATLLGLDGIPLDAVTQERYLLAGSFDSDAFAAGDYVLAIGPAIDMENEHYDALPVPPVGSTVDLDGRAYTVMAVVYPLTPIDEGAMEGGVTDDLTISFIVPTNTFRTLWPENTLRKLYVNAADSAIPAVQALLDAYTAETDPSLPVTSRQTMSAQYAAETRSAAVTGSAISVVIALVGVLNFVNSMVTAIVSRKKEFAVIQSVGMTKKQLCRMLVFEGLSYAALTLAVSFVLSAAAVGIGVRAMVEGGFSTFRFTLLPLAVCTPVILAFAVLIPYVCFKNLEGQSIVERLRMNG